MKAYGYRFISLFALSTLVACSSVDSVRPFDHRQAALLLQQNYIAKPTKYRIALRLPNKQRWVKIDLSQHTIGTPVMLVPRGQTVDDWDESFRTEISDYDRDPDMNATKLIQQHQQQAEQDCKEVKLDIINVSPDDVMFRMRTSHCQQEKETVQIGKAFNASDAVYMVYYSTRIDRQAEVRLHAMTPVIHTARLALSL